MLPRISRMSSISVLTHICSDISQPSLLLQGRDGKRYILGRLGEGFQRSLVEHRVKSTKLSGIFLSGPLNWASVAGLPGYLLSLAEVHKISSVTTGVPDRAHAMIGSWKRFNIHGSLNVSVACPTYQDNNVAIQAVVLPELPESESPTPSHLQEPVRSTSYIIQMLPTRGKFMVNKARLLGVPSGPLFAQLSSGASVTTPDGRIVNPEDVLEPSLTPVRALLLDLPTDAHVSAALNYQWCRRIKRKGLDDEAYTVDIKVIYYFLGASVDLKSPSMKQLVESFGPETTQLISHPSVSPDLSTFKGFQGLQEVFSQTLPDAFSPVHEAAAAHHLPADLKALGCHVLQQGDSISLLPNQSTEITTITPGRPASSGTVTQGLDALTEPEVLTLGTGASNPSKYRNVSGTLVRIPAKGKQTSVLFDCGEGTLNTLKRLYGPEMTAQFLVELDTIFISHMHADHHLGVLQLIQEWQHVNPDRAVVLFGPANMRIFLEEWASLDNTIDLDRVAFVDHEDIVMGKGYGETKLPVHFQTLYPKLGHVGAGVCRALHCDRSYSGYMEYELSSGGNFRVAYSGDTRPSKYFAQVAKDSDLLIHEATHEDDLAVDAKAKGHSTIGGALKVATDMGAQHVVLTHFSQRYPKLPSIGQKKFNAPTCFAFDGMKVPISAIMSLQNSLGSLENVFASIEKEEVAVTN